MKNKLKILSIITVMSLLVGAFGILPAAAATVSVSENTAEWANQDGEAVTHVKPDTVGVFWVKDADLETTKTGIARWYNTPGKVGAATAGASWNIGTGGVAASASTQEIITSSQHYITATHYNASNATKTPLTAAPTVTISGVSKLVTGFDLDGQFTLAVDHPVHASTTATFTYHIQDLYYGTSTTLRRAKVTSTSDPSGEYITIEENVGPGTMAEGLDGVYRIHATSTINWITNSGLTTTVNSDGRGVIVDRDGNGTVDGGDVTVIVHSENLDYTLASSTIASVNPSTGAITFATAQTTTASTTVYYQSSVTSPTSDLYRGDLQLSSNASAQGTNDDGIWVQDGDTVTITYLNSSGTAVDTDTVTVDAVLPTVTNISPGDGTTQNVVNPTVQFDVTDTGSGISSTNVSTDITININGNDISSSSPSFQAITDGFRVIFASGSSWVTSYSVVDSTAFTWTITATDAARNTKTLTGSSLDLTIDTTKPTVSSAVTGTSWNTDTAAEGTAESNTSVKVTLSENILASSVQAADFTVGGVAPTAAVVGSTTGYKNIIYLTTAVQDPDARPVVAVTGSVTDIGGNAVNTSSTTAGDYSATATDGLKPGLTVAVSSDLLIAAGATTVTADTTEKLGTDGVIISIHGPSGASNAGKATVSAPTPKQSTGTFTAATGDLTGKYGVSVQATDLGANTKDNLTAVTGEAVAAAKITAAGVVTLAKTPIADANFDGVINASDITSITFGTSSQTSTHITAVDASAGTLTFGSGFGTSETATVSYKYTANTFEVDHSAPTITYLPANAATVKVSSPYITVTFDEDEYPGDSYKTVTLTKAEVTKPDGTVEDIKAKFVTSDNAEYIWAASNLALGKYTLKISGQDTAGNKITDNTSSFTVAARDLYSISLRPGWNLISLPGDATDSAINTVITDADIDTVISYDPTVAGSWTTAVRNAAGQLEGTLTNVVAGKGYWVHTSTFDPIKVDIPGLTAGASTLPPSFSLVAGWNLVSAGTLTLTQTTRDADEYFAGLSWSRAYSYSNTSNSFSSILPDANTADDTEISIGQGYWLFLKAAGTLVP